MVVTISGMGVLMSGGIDGRDIGGDQVITPGREVLPLIGLHIETGYHLEVMLLIEDLGILGVEAPIEVIILVEALAHTRLPGRVVSTPCGGDRILIRVVVVDREYVPVILCVEGIVVTLSTDDPALKRHDLERHLLIESVGLLAIQSSVTHLQDLGPEGIVTIGVIDNVCRPATCNVVEEESGQIRGTLIVLAGPLVVVGEAQPRGEVGSDLTAQVISAELILTMPDQSTLVENSRADVVLDLVRSTTDRDIMLL